MLVIVEGPDGAGKTTLIEKLRGEVRTNFLIVRQSNRVRSAPEIVRFNSMARATLDYGFAVLFDRYPLISEKIYGNVIRGKSLVDQDWDEIARLLKRLHERATIIYCRPSASGLIKAHLQNRPQMEGVLEKIDQLIVNYDKAMSQLSKRLPVVDYDWTVGDDVTKFVTERFT